MPTSRAVSARVLMLLVAVLMTTSCGADDDTAERGAPETSGSVGTVAAGSEPVGPPSSAPSSPPSSPPPSSTPPPTSAPPISPAPPASSALVDGDYRTSGATRDQLVASAVAAGVVEADAVAALETIGLTDSAYAVLRINDGGWSVYTSLDGGPLELTWRGSYTTSEQGSITATDGYCTLTFRHSTAGRDVTFGRAASECLSEDPLFDIATVMTYRSGPFTRLDPPPPGTEVSYSTTDFAIPFDVTLPAWVTPVPVTEETNVLLWEGSSEDRGIRFVAPVSVYPPGSSTAQPLPDDYVGYLLSQESAGAELTDVTETTVGGRPATVVTANVGIRTEDSLEGIDGSLGCQADGLAAAECFGPQPEVTLRIAVIDLDPAPLLVWLRDIRRSDGEPLEDETFDAMLASISFRDR